MKITIDSNALLNGAFVPESFSRQAIDAARRSGATLYVGDATVHESRDVAVREARRVGRRADPWPYIDRYIRAMGICEIDRDKGIAVPPTVPKKDANVFQEAITCRGELLTSDADLWLACRDLGTPAIFPLQLLRRINGESLAYVVLGVPPSKVSGSIFMRAFPGSWAANPSGQKFTLLHFGGAFWIYYDGTNRRWTVEIPGHRSLTRECVVEEGKVQTIEFSWREGEQLSLRVADAEHPDIASMYWEWPREIGERAQVGGHPSGEHYWGGAIRYCINNDRPMGTPTWRQMRMDVDITPNPFDSDRLSRAIAATLPF